ncbi:histidine phosphatase superfamily [Pavlovales sp. CCMP2436]|nr:histidine phosphatase superfamily [Pavlovales sp. CCMP2436]
MPPHLQPLSGAYGHGACTPAAEMPLRDSPTCITSGAYGTELCAVTFDDDDVKYESTDPGGDSEAEWESGETELNTVTASSARNGSPAQILDPAAAAAASKTRKARGGREQVVVIIRHGKTEHNKLGLFTGWEDVPLAAEGAAEAMAAGRLLAQHGFKFDIVYTSWLSRSIATAWLVLEQLDAVIFF